MSADALRPDSRKFTADNVVQGLSKRRKGRKTMRPTLRTLAFISLAIVWAIVETCLAAPGDG